jgi:hypothetical protein
MKKSGNLDIIKFLKKLLSGKDPVKRIKTQSQTGQKSFQIQTGSI